MPSYSAPMMYPQQPMPPVLGRPVMDRHGPPPPGFERFAPAQPPPPQVTPPQQDRLAEQLAAAVKQNPELAAYVASLVQQQAPAPPVPSVVHPAAVRATSPPSYRPQPAFAAPTPAFMPTVQVPPKSPTMETVDFESLTNSFAKVGIHSSAPETKPSRAQSARAQPPKSRPQSKAVPLAFDKDYNFEEALSEFRKDAGPVVRDLQSPTDRAPAYKKSSFFDDISCESKEKLLQQ